MSKKLSPRQIDDLFQFCEEQDVYQYDLKLELVDHLACSIEKKWDEDHNLSYEDALWQVFDAFGNSGFSKIRKEKEKVLRKKYRHLQWQYIGEFFKLPKIILTASIAFFFFTVLRFTTNNYQISIIFMAATFLYSIYCRKFLYPKKFELKIIDGMTFMLTEYQKTFYRSVTNIVYLPMNVFTVVAIGRKHYNIADFANNIYFEFGISIILALFIITLTVVLIYIPQRIKNDFSREFPQFVKD